MQDGKKRNSKKSGSDATQASAQQAQKGGDHSTEQLKAMGKKLGNDELQQRIQKGNASRDELMDFLKDRLHTMRDVQKREILASDSTNHREHWRQISDQQKTEVTNPDPTRWREAARIYEQAAYQLARGSLGRGQQLVEKAMAEEKRTFDKLTSIIHVTEEELQELESGPDCAMDAAPTDACAATEVPTEVQELARAIQRVTEKAPEVPGRKRVRDPWWTLEEEEEEEEEGGGAG